VATEQDYLREVSISDNRATGDTSIGLSEAVSIVGESYPEVYAARQSIEVDGSRRAGLYSVGVSGTGEFLTAYVDAHSRAVFSENRRVSLARMAPVPAANTSESGYQLSIARTYRGGPVRITIIRESTGEPVDAAVSINDRSVGRSGQDGELWATASGSTTTVEASVDASMLSASFAVPPPPHLNRTRST
jgi:hypothetical protein